VTWKRYREAIPDTSTIPLASFEAAATPLLGLAVSLRARAW
jgi:hypothetical protein